MKIKGDNPIQQPEDDVLGRDPLARRFARKVLSLDTSEGAVVGVLGAWGFGKTSFVNLARKEFERAEVPILDFNPWMFSGAEQLVQSFFVEIAAQLKIRPGLEEIGESLENYGEAFSGMGWLPIVGPWFERSRVVTKSLAKILRRRKEGTSGQRDKLRKALGVFGKPIVVVLDDIDRLSTNEIREVFKLVRLTASFPNIIYVLAFDRKRIEQALGEQGVPGRDYLEKILQVAVDLPEIPSQVLDREIFNAMESILASIEKQGPFDELVWPDVFTEIIKPLVRNMRDVRRYCAAIDWTVDAMEGQVALIDVLALESVRIFLPDVFGKLHGAVECLTRTTSDTPFARNDQSLVKAQLEDLIPSERVYGEVVHAMIRRLFPAGFKYFGGGIPGEHFKGYWLREGRVAHGDNLRLYLERVAGEGLQTFRQAKEAWTCMTDRDALEEYLRSQGLACVQDIVGSLVAFSDQFKPVHVVPATITLLNLLPELPERKRGMFEEDARMIFVRVIHRLLGSVDTPSEIENLICKILPEVRSLSSKLVLISLIGHKERVGVKFVSEITAEELEKAWRDEVRTASVDTLIAEFDLLRVLLAVKRNASISEEPVKIDRSPEFTLALLRSARSEIISTTGTSGKLHRSPSLGWEALVEIYGSEETLKAQLDQVRELDSSDDVLELADKYCSGRSPDFDGG